MHSSERHSVRSIRSHASLMNNSRWSRRDTPPSLTRLHSHSSDMRLSHSSDMRLSRTSDNKPLSRTSDNSHRRSTVSFASDVTNVDFLSEIAESDEKSDAPWDVVVNLDESDIRTREEYKQSQKQIMVLNFINGAEEKVAVWRPPANKTSKDLNKMPLAIRAAFIEDMVASRFCKWLRGLGGRTPNLDEKSLKELFQIGIVNPTSASIRTICEERTFIPDLVAEKLNLPEKTLLNQLQRQLEWDMWAERRPERTKAFGKMVEPCDQFRPPNNHTRQTWLACHSIPKHMQQYTQVAYNSIMAARGSRDSS
ncbi:uncharacterized protein LOC111054543 [Nilaparvata lugens]|uniref:uncharacterized protein LOC111054543 n=1 Tax=Nilaparvata lugens TaxID=108931 RepID=UPI00193D3DF8|nr:uncharacterized protein LOC111054543 [Nilaparvata lugens]